MIYFLQPTDGGPIKIGTAIDVDVRRKQLEVQYRQPLALLATMPGGRREERVIHDRFADHRLGNTEQFRPVAEIMAFIGRPLLVDIDPDAVEAMVPVSQAVRLDLSPADHKRLDRHASALGLSMSSYARMAVLERMKADEAKGGTK
jgi:hypothetical protein